MTPKKLKITGLALLLVPSAVLAIFFVGETVGQMEGSFIHLVQLLPILILSYIAWRWSFVGGVLLITIATFIGAIYAFTAPFSIVTILLVEGLLVLFPIL